MTNNRNHENFIIVGCGRVGAELATSIARKGRNVSVMDSSQKAFERLGTEFRGRTVQGDALDHEALKRAGIAEAHGLAAVTTSDSANVVTARIARDMYRVPHVVARVYDPARAPLYERLGLQTIASSSWGAKRMEQLLLHPGLQSVYSAGNGEVQVYEIAIPEAWAGRTVGELLPPDLALPVTLDRGGRGILPTHDRVLELQDILVVSATADGVLQLRERLQLHGRT